MMDELIEEWLYLTESGECDEDFDSWYSGKVDQAMDKMELER